MHVGNGIMLFRKFKKKTQKELAKKLNTSQQYIAEVEKQMHLTDNLLDKILIALNSNREEWENFKSLLFTKQQKNNLSLLVLLSSL